MAIRQLSVFVENKQGSLHDITDALAQGQAANIRLVNAFAVPDQPGGLAKVLSLLEGKGVNIEYMYALITSEDGKAYSVMRTGDTEETDEILKSSGIELLDEAKLQ